MLKTFLNLLYIRSRYLAYPWMLAVIGVAQLVLAESYMRSGYYVRQELLHSGLSSMLWLGPVITTWVVLHLQSVARTVEYMRTGSKFRTSTHELVELVAVAVGIWIVQVISLAVLATAHELLGGGWGRYEPLQVLLILSSTAFYVGLALPISQISRTWYWAPLFGLGIFAVEI